jgi:hypothetical protein
MKQLMRVTTVSKANNHSYETLMTHRHFQDEEVCGGFVIVFGNDFHFI